MVIDSSLYTLLAYGRFIERQFQIAGNLHQMMKEAVVSFSSLSKYTREGRRGKIDV